MKTVSKVLSVKLVIAVLLTVSFSASKAQYSRYFIEEEDIYASLEFIGLNIYKFALVSDSTYSVNILQEEYLNHECVDSVLFVDEEGMQTMKSFGFDLSVNQDTSFLRIITKQETDSTIRYIARYRNMNFSDREMKYSLHEHGKHKFREFASPKIQGKGKYPVLMLGCAWKQDFNGRKIDRFCYTEKIEEINSLIDHFFVISIVVD